MKQRIILFEMQTIKQLTDQFTWKTIGVNHVIALFDYWIRWDLPTSPFRRYFGCTAREQLDDGSPWQGTFIAGNWQSALSSVLSTSVVYDEAQYFNRRHNTRRTATGSRSLSNSISFVNVNVPRIEPFPSGGPRWVEIDGRNRYGIVQSTTILRAIEIA